MSWRDTLKSLREHVVQEKETEKIIENDSTNEREDLKMNMMKKFIYLAVDTEGKPMLDSKGELIFSYITEEGKLPQWDKDPRKKYKTSDDFKVELDKSKVNEEGKEAAKTDARNKLKKMYEDFQKKNGNEVMEEKKAEEQGIMRDVAKESTSEVDIKENTVGEICNKKEVSDATSVKAVYAAKTEIVSEIENAKQVICEDLANTGDYLYKKAQEKLEKNVGKIQKNVETVEQNIQKSAENLSRQINDTTKVLKNDQEQIKSNQEIILSREKTILKKVEQIGELCEVTEMLEGKLNKLDQIDAVISLLSDKGVEISREFPPTCEEEEDIINLVRYSKKITEQLGYAARDLIRKRAAYDSKEQSIANEQKIIEEKIAEAYNAGIKKGKLEVINALLGKYTDIDTIIESDIDHVRMIWALLKDFGVDFDGDGYFKKGEIISFGVEEAEKMAATYKKFDGAGKYKVVKSGLVYKDEIVFKAEFERVIEDTDKKVTETEVIEGTQEVETEQINE